MKNKFSFPDFYSYKIENLDAIKIVHEFCDEFFEKFGDSSRTKSLGVALRCVPHECVVDSDENNYDLIVFNIENPGFYKVLLTIMRDGHILHIGKLFYNMTYKNDIKNFHIFLNNLANSPEFVTTILSMAGHIKGIRL